MADQIAIVEFSTPISNTLVDVTSPDITEAFSAALFFFISGNTNSADNDHGQLGIGACVPSVSASRAANNASSMTHGDNTARTAPDYNTDRKSNDTAASAIQVRDATATGTVTSRAFYSSSISGGVRLNFDIATVQSKVVAILFAGLSGSGVGAIATSGTLSELVGDAPHFTPDVIAFFGGGGVLNVITANGNDAEALLGFAVRGGNQVSAFADIDDVTEPTDADGRVDTTHSQVVYQAGVRTTRLSDVSAYNADGFDWHADTGVSRTTMYLALKFSSAVRLNCVAQAISSSTGAQSFTGFGFSPSVVIGMSTLLASADTDTSGNTASSSGYFVTGVKGSRAQTWQGENGKTNVGAATFNTHNRAEAVGLLTYTHTASIAQRATWNGLVTDGFSLDFSVATTGFLVALGIQLAPVANDTETISDGVVFTLRAPLTETETIADGVVFIGVGSVSFTETETIADEFVLRMAGMAALVESVNRGWTFAAGARRGTSFQAGGEAGAIL